MEKTIKMVKKRMINEDKNINYSIFAQPEKFLSQLIYHEIASTSNYLFNDMHMECLNPQKANVRNCPIIYNRKLTKM